MILMIKTEVEVEVDAAGAACDSYFAAVLHRQQPRTN